MLRLHMHTKSVVPRFWHDDKDLGDTRQVVSSSWNIGGDLCRGQLFVDLLTFMSHLR